MSKGYIQRAYAFYAFLCESICVLFQEQSVYASSLINPEDIRRIFPYTIDYTPEYNIETNAFGYQDLFIFFLREKEKKRKRGKKGKEKKKEKEKIECLK